MSTYVVTSPANSGPGTLRDAVASTATDIVITTPDIIVLNSTLNITRGLTIRSDNGGRAVVSPTSTTGILMIRITLGGGIDTVVFDGVNFIAVEGNTSLCMDITGRIIIRNSIIGTDGSVTSGFISSLPTITIGSSRSITLENVEFRGNEVTTNLAVLNVQNDDLFNTITLDVTNCIFDNNITTSGSCIRVLDQTPVNFTGSITDCTFSNNNGTATYFVTQGQTDYSFINCTIANNVSSVEAGIRASFGSDGSSSFRITNCTIANNTSLLVSTLRGIGINVSTGSLPAIIQNTLVVNNLDGNNILRDVRGSVSSDSANNLLSSDPVGLWPTFFDPTKNNILDPNASTYLGPLANNGGPTQTIALLPGSQALNNGNNSFVGPSIDYDQRGIGFNRIVGPFVDIGAFEYQTYPVPCFDGDSLVLTRNIETGIEEVIPVKFVYTDIHEVFDTINKVYTPVRSNTISIEKKNIVLIKKNALGLNKPSRDFYVTGGHKLYINNEEVKAIDVKEGRLISTEPRKVYNISIDYWAPIFVNNIDVFAWNHQQWLDYVAKRGGVCVENRPSIH